MPGDHAVLSKTVSCLITDLSLSLSRSFSREIIDRAGMENGTPRQHHDNTVPLALSFKLAMPGDDSVVVVVVVVMTVWWR